MIDSLSCWGLGSFGKEKILSRLKMSSASAVPGTNMSQRARMAQILQEDLTAKVPGKLSGQERRCVRGGVVDHDLINSPYLLEARGMEGMFTEKGSHFL